MPQFAFGNFFATELLANITTGTTQLQVPPSSTLLLPHFDVVDNTEARLTLWDGQLPPEIVGCTVNLQDGNLTVTRGLEGTTPQAWGAGTQVISILSAEVVNAALAAYFDFNAVLAASFLKLSGGVLTGPLILAADPAVALGAATKQYVDSVQGTGLPLSGGTMQGDINMNSNNIINLPAPSIASNPATKAYADSLITSPIAILNDFEGSLVSGGSTSAYTVTTNQGGGGGLVNGDRLCIKFAGTNAAAATLNRDGLGARALQLRPGVAIPANIIVAGVPTSVTFDAVQNAWILDETHELEDNIVTNAKLRDSGALSVIGRSANSSGDPADISVAAGSGLALRESGNVLGFGQLGTAAIADGAITNVKTAGPRRTTTILTSGSGTYNTPANVKSLVIHIKGGGGGGSKNQGGFSSGGTGGTSTFNSVNAVGGGPGQVQAGGLGGTGGTGTATFRFQGSAGGHGGNNGGGFDFGASGGAGIWGNGGGAGGDNAGGTPTAGAANTGGGGGGDDGGSGGGGGEHAILEIQSPAASYSFTVGAGGTAGGAQSAAGGSGVIIVEEYY